MMETIVGMQLDLETVVKNNNKNEEW